MNEEVEKALNGMWKARAAAHQRLDAGWDRLINYLIALVVLGGILGVLSI